jgi:uncharacterized protein with HEPN domain
MEHGIQIIGEAARRVSDDFKQAHPEIPWRSIVAQRNVIVHQYEDIDYYAIWQVAAAHAPALVQQLEGLLPEVDKD